MSRELFAYWDALRAGRSAPERSAIDPAAIRDLLAHTFLLEVGQPGSSGCRAVSFRLSGTRLNALFRRELKGETFAGLWVKDDEAEALALVDGVLDDGAPMVAGVRASPKDYQPVDFEVLLLPLRHHGRTHARLLGSIVAETVPSWIGLRPIEGLRLAAFRTILPRDGVRLGTFGAAASDVAALGVEAATRRSRALPAAVPSASVVTRPFRVFEGGLAAGRPVSTGAVADPG